MKSIPGLCHVECFFYLSESVVFVTSVMPAKACEEKTTDCERLQNSFIGLSPSSSSSPSYYSHFYVGSMYDDIRLHVARP